ncbi:hypothetical protein [Streptomyces sp. G45]|uniref:hypothetical protein n=1 Tax=Streptomyces sp. G45 TaxID=3406627 RepID=UPI003C277BB6
MELAGIALLVAGALIPGVTKLLDSVAYRNRARGRAVIIRARGGRTRGRGHG